MNERRLNPPTFIADQGLAKAVLSRLLGWNGAAVKQADLTSITRAIWYPGAVPVQQGSDQSLTVTSVIFDSWQTNAEAWPFDDAGYNFLDVIPGALLSTLQTRQVQYTFTPSAGEAFGFEVLLQIRRRYGA